MLYYNVEAMGIAKRMTEKAAKSKTSRLKVFLKKRVPSKEFQELSIDKIDDFPVLKRKQIKSKILFGSFQLRLCQSDIIDLIRGKMHIF